MVHCVEGARIIDEEATYIVGAFIEFRINKICDINQGSGCTACGTETELVFEAALFTETRPEESLNYDLLK